MGIAKVQRGVDGNRGIAISVMRVSSILQIEDAAIVGVNETIGARRLVLPVAACSVGQPIHGGNKASDLPRQWKRKGEWTMERALNRVVKTLPLQRFRVRDVSILREQARTRSKGKKRRQEDRFVFQALCI